MDPIELARSLPKRQRYALYAKALIRLALPSMPWPAWLALCGAAALLAMGAAWKYASPSLPNLMAEPVLSAFALIFPSLALDGLLRKIPGAGRSRMSYLIVPLLACAGLACALHWIAEPLARSEARADRAAQSEARASALLARAQVQFDLASGNASRHGVAEGLRVGLARAKKTESPVAKPASLPPIPLPPGAIPEKPASTAADAVDAEAFEYASKHAIATLEANSSMASKALSDTSKQSLAMAHGLRGGDGGSAPEATALASSWLWQAALATWIGAPIAALILSHGLTASILWPFTLLARLIAAAAALAWVPVRKAVASVLAPTPDELADLHRRARAYQSVQAELDQAQAHAHGIPASAAGALDLADLAVSFEFTSHMQAREGRVQEKEQEAEPVPA